MTFHEPTNWGMIVMDGRRHVARARKVVSGGWMLRIYAGSWTHPDARIPAFGRPRGATFPYLMHVKTKAAARKELRALAAV